MFPLIPLPIKEAVKGKDGMNEAFDEAFPLIPLPIKEAVMQVS